MTRIVTLEEHYATPDNPADQGVAFTPGFARFVADRIGDVTRFRIPEMDASGVDVQVLSITMPAVQWMDSATGAATAAARMNDGLAAVVAARPDRFAAFAALPCQDPGAAVRELHRCVEDLGFVGAMVHGHTGGVYLDDERYAPLWSAFDALGVPMYLHPTFPAEPPAVLRGHPQLQGAVWGWAFETGSHLLRLVVSGVFERHPGATVIVGHMGEGLPYALNRLDERWSAMRHERDLPQPPSHYLRANTYLTTAGSEDPAALRCAISTMGADRVLFSVDYPYQSIASAVSFLHTADLTGAERAAVSSGNADRLLRLTG